MFEITAWPGHIAFAVMSDTLGPSGRRVVLNWGACWIG